MKDVKDYYIYSLADMCILCHNLTIEEAKDFKAKIDAEFPDEAGISIIARVSDDYKLAAERAFTHLVNW